MTTANAIELYNPDVYARAMPHDVYTHLRREAPVFWQEEPNGPGYWASSHRGRAAPTSRKCQPTQ
jgi:cholest-4-en-3-one 26-monooxygenase